MDKITGFIDTVGLYAAIEKRWNKEGEEISPVPSIDACRSVVYYRFRNFRFQFVCYCSL